MKKILILVAITTISFTSYSQSLGYNDLGILFSQDEQYASSRFNAMSGAFGALGGDISSIGINPAGGAVAKNSSVTITVGNKNSNINANYYGKNKNSQDIYFNLSQIGGLLSFEKPYNSDWSRFSVIFNYRIKNDFDKYYSIKGNNGKALFNEHPNDPSVPKIKYDNAQEQHFTNIINGSSKVFNIGFSSVYQNKIYVGASLNIHNTKLEQITRLNEKNKDVSGNILTAFNEQNSSFNGSGISVSLGFIYKPIQYIRLGLAYESPTWYQEFTEDSNINVFDPNDNRYNHWLGYTEIHANNINTDINSGQEISSYVFNLKTPSRITLSTAFIFKKIGLISIDYTHKDYKTIRFENGNFDSTNESFTNNYKNTNAINIGTEWRLDRLSLRGGFHYKQTPYMNNWDSSIKGFSLGFGYNFSGINLDLAYKNTKNKSSYVIYNYPIQPITIDNKNSIITATVTIGL